MASTRYSKNNPQKCAFAILSSPRATPGCAVGIILAHDFSIRRWRGSMIQRMEARRLSSSTEWSLISSSLPPALGALSVARLKSKIGRAGKLRQKYWDLYRRQRHLSKSRGTGAYGVRSNAETLRKRKMFDEAIARLRLQLDKISQRPKTSARRPHTKSAKTRTRRTHSRVAQQRDERRNQRLKSRAASPALPKTAKRRAAGHTRRHSSMAASTRRRQSRRDSRG